MVVGDRIGDIEDALEACDEVHLDVVRRGRDLLPGGREMNAVRAHVRYDIERYHHITAKEGSRAHHNIGDRHRGWPHDDRGNRPVLYYDVSADVDTCLLLR